MTYYSDITRKETEYTNTSYVRGDVIDYSNYEITTSGTLSTSGYIVNDIKFLKVGMPFSVNGFNNAENNGDFVVSGITRITDNTFYVYTNPDLVTENNESGIINIDLFDRIGYHEQKIQASDKELGDYFGNAVAMADDVMVVGAKGENTGGGDAGAAYIFRYNGSSWLEEQKIQGSDLDGNDYFGYSVAIDNNIIVVGAPWKDGGGGYAGAIYIFRYNRIEWVEEQKIQRSGIQANDRYGYSVAIDNDVIITGAYGEDTNGSMAGAAYIYRYNGSTWEEEQRIISNDIAASDYFGQKVAVDNNITVIGAYGKDNGSVYMFKYYPEVSGGMWIEEQKIQSSDIQPNDYFGNSVAIDNDVIVVGAYGEDTGESGAGAAYIFRYNGIEWIEEQKIQASDKEANDKFSKEAVSIENDTIIIGAYEKDSYTGAVYIFRYDGSSWIEIKKMQSSDIQLNDYFGYSVLIKNNIMVIGAEYEDVDNLGAAYIYDLKKYSIPENYPVEYNKTAEQWQLYEGTKPTAYCFRELGDVVIQNGLVPIQFYNKDKKRHLYPNESYYTLGGDNAVMSRYLVGTQVDENNFLLKNEYIYNTSNNALGVDGAGGYVFGKMQGGDLDGGDNFGISTAIDNDMIVVGAYNEDTGGSAVGAVYIFRYNGSSWIEEQKLQASDKEANDKFGYAISIDNDVIAVGAYKESTGETEAGAAYIFKYHSDISGGIWIEEQKIQADTPIPDESLGTAIAIENNTLIVGAFGDNAANGAAYVFNYNGSAWEQTQRVEASDKTTDDWFGLRVAIQGDLMVIGAEGEVDNNKAYIFRYNGSEWIEEQKLEGGTKFGTAVSIYNNRVVIGAYNADTIYIYKYNGTSWTEEQSITSEVSGSRFGRSVVIKDDKIIVGAELDSDKGVDAGAAYIFRYNGSEWIEEQKIYAPDAEAGDYFGGLISSVYNDIIVIGAQLEGTGGSVAGAAYIFQIT